MGMLTIVTVYHSAMPHATYDHLDMSVLTLPPNSIASEQDLIDTDFVYFKILLSIWIAFNVLFMGIYKVRSRQENTKFINDAKNDQEGFKRQGLSRWNSSSTRWRL